MAQNPRKSCQNPRFHRDLVDSGHSRHARAIRESRRLSSESLGPARPSITPLVPDFMFYVQAKLLAELCKALQCSAMQNLARAVVLLESGINL